VFRVSNNQSTVWIVVPAFNEACRLAATLAPLIRLYPHVVVIDDGSHDETALVARRAGAWVLRHALNCGQGAALQTGITFALARGAEFVVTFDADGQHDPRQIADLLDPLRKRKAEVALGSRFLGRAEGIPWTRRLVLKAGVCFTRLVSRIRVTDAHNGLRAMTKQAAGHIHLMQNRMAHASEILDQIKRARLRFVEVPVTIRYTPETLAKGQSSLQAVKIASEFVLGRMIK